MATIHSVFVILAFWNEYCRSLTFKFRLILIEKDIYDLEETIYILFKTIEHTQCIAVHSKKLGVLLNVCLWCWFEVIFMNSVKLHSWIQPSMRLSSWHYFGIQPSVRLSSWHYCGHIISKHLDSRMRLINYSKCWLIFFSGCMNGLS